MDLHLKRQVLPCSGCKKRRGKSSSYYLCCLTPGFGKSCSYVLRPAPSQARWHINHLHPAISRRVAGGPQLEEAALARRQQRLQRDVRLLRHVPPPLCTTCNMPRFQSECCLLNGGRCVQAERCTLEATLHGAGCAADEDAAVHHFLRRGQGGFAEGRAPGVEWMQSKSTSGLRWCRSSMSLPRPMSSHTPDHIVGTQLPRSIIPVQVDEDRPALRIAWHSSLEIPRPAASEGSSSHCRSQSADHSVMQHSHCVQHHAAFALRTALG